MGRLWSYGTEPQGHVVNGVLLGEPVEIDGDPATWEWDDGAYPDAAVTVIDGQLEMVIMEEAP